MKYGTAVPSIRVHPLGLEKTSPTWNGGSWWSRVYPPGSMDLNLFSSNQGARYLSTFYIVAVEIGNLLSFHSNQNQYILFVVALS